jgi:hypothetical protein
MFQAPITYTNIVYSVFKHNLDKDKADVTYWLIQGKLAQYLASIKIIVYGGTIEQTTELSQVLDYYKYYYKVSNCEKKKEIIERW